MNRRLKYLLMVFHTILITSIASLYYNPAYSYGDILNNIHGLMELYYWFIVIVSLFAYCMITLIKTLVGTKYVSISDVDKLKGARKAYDYSDAFFNYAIFLPATVFVGVFVGDKSMFVAMFLKLVFSLGTLYQMDQLLSKAKNSVLK